MVTKQSVNAQLRRLNFSPTGWGHGEVNELPGILLEDEQIFELVNGIYEGGFALLVATDIRMLLVDKKPLNFLTVEDLRFDMISELDYSHRLVGAHVNVAAGSKNLQFRSYNQPRLRKLITHVQHCMADGKKKQDNHQSDQNSHLEQINQQLQEYLIAQHEQQERLHEQLKGTATAKPSKAKAALKEIKQLAEPVKPSGKLADYLFAQSLLARHKKDHKELPAEKRKQIPAHASKTEDVIDLTPMKEAPEVEHVHQPIPAAANLISEQGDHLSPLAADMYAEGMQEIFGRAPAVKQEPTTASQRVVQASATIISAPIGMAIDPLKIAYSKLPLALRNRRYGSPSFHAHSMAATSRR